MSNFPCDERSHNLRNSALTNHFRLQKTTRNPIRPSAASTACPGLVPRARTHLSLMMDPEFGSWSEEKCESIQQKTPTCPCESSADVLPSPWRVWQNQAYNLGGWEISSQHKGSVRILLEEPPEPSRLLLLTPVLSITPPLLAPFPEEALAAPGSSPHNLPLAISDDMILIGRAVESWGQLRPHFWLLIAQLLLSWDLLCIIRCFHL